MGFDRTKIKQICQIILFSALLIVGIIYIKEVWSMIKVLVDVLKPFIIGGVIAFILNIPLNGIEKKILRKWRGKLADKIKRPLSIVLSIIFVLLIITVVTMTVVPQLTNTIIVLGKKMPAVMNDIISKLKILSEEYPQIETYIVELQSYKFDWNSIIANLVNFLKSGVSNIFSSTFTVASSILGGFANFLIGFIFAIYILAQKETISQALKKVLTTYIKPENSERILKVCSLLYINFANFITGQCVEALILGSMFVISMLIFKLPYALMIGVLIAFTALIPIVGAFIGCFIGSILMLVDSPTKAIIFIILFLVIQQIEGNLIYPKVVGDKVGLPSILVLMAITIGGGLFGMTGMLIFIPIVSTIYTLIKENIAARNTKKAKITKTSKS